MTGGDSARMWRNWRYEHGVIVLVSLTCAAYYEWWLRLITASGFPLDDAWIHLQFARNLARGEFFAFYAGTPTQVKSINDMQVRAAHWVRDHTGPDAVVATNDIGAIGNFSQRKVIDTEGLVTPAILPYRRQGNIVLFLEQVRPALVVVFPEWHPEIARRPDLFKEMKRFTARPRVIAPADSLVVYSSGSLSNLGPAGSD